MDHNTSLPTLKLVPRMISSDKARGFLNHPRKLPAKRPVEVRLQDSLEIYADMPEDELRNQAARCMDCGIPFCHAGCPLGNHIPNWNDLVYKQNWEQAFRQLISTNNFPEFTGRICPAPCESACVLGLVDDPVTIEQIEKEIIEHAFAAGWVEPNTPDVRTGKRVAVIGSGPAGLACADQLNKAGHLVTVFERDDRPGGLLQYGIPDFKLDKAIVHRRIELMKVAGIQFETGIHIGKNYPVSDLDAFDATVLCIGATKPRDLPIPGRAYKGIHFAWDYLWQQNKRVAGEENEFGSIVPIHAEGKHVVVIGGGDTGSDCVGTANRQKAQSVVQFELMPTPPDVRPDHQPWPYYPMMLRTTTSHEEGAERNWSIMTKSFEGVDGQVTAIHTVNVNIDKDENGRMRITEIEGSETVWPADLVLLAIGYTGPQPDGLVADLELTLNRTGAIETEDYQTSRAGVFAAGDGRRGQSLVVWAISEGREAAYAVDQYLMGTSTLPVKGGVDIPRV